MTQKVIAKEAGWLQFDVLNRSLRKLDKGLRSTPSTRRFNKQITGKYLV